MHIYKSRRPCIAHSALSASASLAEGRHEEGLASPFAAACADEETDPSRSSFFGAAETSHRPSRWEGMGAPWHSSAA